MKDDKTLNRIRKLLAMAADTSSPNEAAIAAGRARTLMDKHQISEMDLRSSAPEDFGTSTQLSFGVWCGMLAVAMAWLNDVNTKYATVQGAAVVQFDGYLVDTVTAKELYLYLLAQVELQSKKVRGRKEPFKRGFAVGVQEQVKKILKEREQLVMSDGRSLVASKRAMVTEHFGAMRTLSVHKSRSDPNFAAGYAAGSTIGLNRQVTGAGQQRIR